MGGTGFKQEWNPRYNQTNQHVMHAVYLFNDAGAPWKTEKWVRTIIEKSYGTGPDGLIGNDDVINTSFLSNLVVYYKSIKTNQE
ncbi:MAG: glycoside hydrolase domain-containing protein [bacterium]